MDMRAKSCCFTGHRSLNGAEKLKVAVRLRKVIKELVKQGIVFYGAGGALGFDTLAAQTILDMKKEYPQLRLILVLPCEDQTRGWRSEDIAVYEDIKRRSDKVVYVSREYTPNCMHRRNRHLVDHSGTCICYLTRDSGGTAYIACAVGYQFHLMREEGTIRFVCGFLVLRNLPKGEYRERQRCYHEKRRKEKRQAAQ